MKEDRTFSMSAVIRGRLYVCGGRGDGSVNDSALCLRPCSSAECFDPLQKGWRSLRPMSVSRWGAAFAVVGDHMYECGGHDVSFRPHNCVERFDTLSEVWEAQLAMVQGRFNAGAAGIRGRIYVVGGRVGIGTK